MDDIFAKIGGIESFTTHHGSVYGFDDNGHVFGTSVAKGMFKTKVEAQDKRDITVFIKLVKGGLEKVKAIVSKEDTKSGEAIYIVEGQLDNTVRIIGSIQEVMNPENLYLAIVKDGVFVSNQKVSLIPVEGCNSFSVRNFEENGEQFTEKAVGGKITEIIYRNAEI